MAEDVTDEQIVRIIDDPQVLARLLAEYTVKLKITCERAWQLQIYCLLSLSLCPLIVASAYAILHSISVDAGGVTNITSGRLHPSSIHDLFTQVWWIKYALIVEILLIASASIVGPMDLHRRYLKCKLNVRTGIVQLARLIRMSSQYHEIGRFKDLVTRWDLEWKLADAEAVLHDAERLIGKREDQLPKLNQAKPAPAEPALPTYQQVSNL